MNYKILITARLKELRQQYLEKYGELPFYRQMPSGATSFPPETTTKDVEDALQKCLSENFKLYEIYPSLKNDNPLNKNKDIDI